jgi:N-methylhydantoinase A/oxoprolinase/acetone carboxylase beta subunit
MEIEAIGARLRKEGIRYTGVVGKFSTRNPQHEMRIQEILGDGFEYMLAGHRISGNLNFPRRIATTYLNAAVHSIYKNFFEAVQDGLEKEGLSVPIYILKADGGTMSLGTSLEYPGQTILSGPAASVMGSLSFASPDHETLVLDIGGTTTDMAVFIHQVPLLDPLGIELGGYKTLIRSLKTHSIGLGGDSAVRIVNGQIKIGPDRRGPALAYGGSAPTPTDALVVLGNITEGNREASRMGIQELADQLGTSLEEVSKKIFRSSCGIILDAARDMIAAINSKPVYTIRELLEGHTVSPSQILVLGGPAPYFASGLASLSDLPVQVVPQWQVANAIGAALARTTCQVTLFADTERGMVTAPEEDFYQPIKRGFQKQDAVDLASELLKKKALQEGAEAEDLETELLEDLQFNMVRGFYTTGRNIRVKLQVKPGLIRQYGQIAPQNA